MFRDVDIRRLVPRTVLLMADPRLAEAERRLGRVLVKAAVARKELLLDAEAKPGRLTRFVAGLDPTAGPSES